MRSFWPLFILNHLQMGRHCAPCLFNPTFFELSEHGFPCLQLYSGKPTWVDKANCIHTYWDTISLNVTEQVLCMYTLGSKV